MILKNANIMYKLFLIPLLAASFNVFSQDVVASAGDQHQNSTASVSWTVGEVVTETFIASGINLTQGFQQGMLTVSSLVEEQPTGLILKVYPNPVLDILILETDENPHNFQLINIHGEVLLNGISRSASEEIDFGPFPGGTYILLVDHKQTYKIIKQ